jgi:hypothetical protein
MTAKSGKGLEISLGTGATRGIGSGYGEDDRKGHGETRVETGDLKPEGIQRNRKA